VAERNLEAEKQRSEASLKAAEAHLADAAAKAERERKLLEKKLSSQEESETAQTAAVQCAQDLKTARAHMSDVKAQEVQLEVKRQDVKLAQSQLVSDQISLSIAQQRLADTKVASPLDGVVSSRAVQIGQIISSGISNVGGGTTALTVSDLSRLFILASVDESDIGNIAPGQSATVTADAFPGERFKGNVVRIATTGVTVQNVTTFEVKIEVDDKKKSMLKPEMTGNVEILVADKPDALVVPVEAVSRRMGRSFVSLKKSDGTVEQQHAIEPGISNGTEVEITSGLNENDVVVLQKNGADSRWRGGNPNQQRGREQTMMMRQMGGGRP
jgi:RND family efflux transporter MFP subunit